MLVQALGARSYRPAGRTQVHLMWAMWDNAKSPRVAGLRRKRHLCSGLVQSEPDLPPPCGEGQPEQEAIVSNAKNSRL